MAVLNQILQELQLSRLVEYT